MKAITAQDWELLWFFEVEPELLDSTVPWIFNDALYRVSRDNYNLTFAVQPSYRDVRLILSIDGHSVYKFSAKGVEDVLYRKENSHETIEIRWHPRNSLVLTMKPNIQIRQDFELE
jgi:hypothetical protein